MDLRTLLACTGLAFCCFAHAQVNNSTTRPWTFVSTRSNELFDTKETFTYIRLTEATFQTLTKTMNASSPPVLEIPAPDGEVLKFQLQPSDALPPQLSTKYPTIKTWKGKDVGQPTLTIRCEYSGLGFHALVEGHGTGSYVIEPVTIGKNLYRVSFKTFDADKTNWTCLSEGKSTETVDPPSAKNIGVFRTYRLALACTGEFAQYHGGTKEDALAAMATLVNRLNGIFERDLGVHLQLVPNNDDIIFLDPATDPFYNSTSHSVLGQNQQVCDQIIGVDNYDVGHLLTTASGGLAQIKSVCSSKKASGVSGSNNPLGDAFFVDYVAHELGHQFGASHTQNNNCNRNPATAVEPGSGSTIMGYAGVCSPNVQPHSDDYFHAISISEIQNYLDQNGACASITVLNEELSAFAGGDLHIPANTPFMLSGEVQFSGNTSAASYTWEQIDNDVAVMPPLAENQAGPAFRSEPPSVNLTRYFPSLDVLLNSADYTWEVLPVAGREMDFRFCARAGNGLVASDDQKVFVENSAGPFSLTYPQGGETWESGQVKTIQWHVANTDKAPVSCQKVDILLSLDGGKSFPYDLVRNTPNDGSYTLVVPPYSSELAYILVKSSDNVFFDITRKALTLKGPSNYSIAFEMEQPKCHGDATGKLTAHVPGATGGISYSWSNGKLTQSIENLAAGLYSVTVQVGANTLVSAAEIVEPEKLNVDVINLPGTNAGTGLLANVSGGTAPYEYHWNSGATARLLYDLSPGGYYLTVTDGNGCSTETSANVLPQTHVKMEFGIAEANNQWQKIELENNYEDIVVIATPIADGSVTPSVVSRLRNCEGNSFEFKLQVAGSENSPTGTMQVSWVVVEAGIYSYSQSGVKFEAGKIVASETSHRGHWLTNDFSYGQEYANPVVLTQVMSFNDDRWSTAWSSASDDATTPAGGRHFSVGKHIGEDNPYPAREDETIGYLIFETGVHNYQGLRLLAANGPPVVQGISDDSEGYQYQIEGFRTADVAVLGASGMVDGDGAWPMLRRGFTEGKELRCWMLEDQVADAERNHEPETVAMLVIGAAEEVEINPETAGFEVGEVRLSPNPASGELTITFDQKEFDGPKLEITDLYGRVLFSQTLLPSEPGDRKVVMPVDALTDGQYFVNIREAYHFHHGKLLVSKL